MRPTARHTHGGSCDVIVTMDRARFAERLLGQNWPENWANCATTQSVPWRWPSGTVGRDRGWAWICTADRMPRS